MVKRKRAAFVKLTNLPMLQNLIRRDPPSYREEFLLQYRHYESQRDIFMSQPEGYEGETFAELVGFMAQVSNCYPDLTQQFPVDLADLLMNHHQVLHPDLREKLVQCLVLLRNRDVIPSTSLLQTLFPILTSTPSKALRSQIYGTIVMDIRNANSKTRNHRLNKTVQTVLFNLVESGKESYDSTVGLWAVKLTREFWKRGIWDDARTVEIMKEASLSANAKVMSGGVRFFLGIDKEKEEMIESDDEEDVDYRQSLGKLRHQAGVSKKTNKKKAHMEKAIEKLKKKEKNKHKTNPLNFSALHLLHDPQGFAEMLFSKHLSRSNNKLTMEQKLLVLQLVTRLIGLHKLNVLGIYSYMLKYLTPRQRDVTHFLACAAQATHDLVPPDVLEPIVRKIADEFVSEGVASEVATAGLNSIREICTRAPLAMNETLLQDLTEYKGSKDKGVMMGARSLIGLYREVAPDMLKRKDRGKIATMGLKEREGLRFGEEAPGTIEGLELLEEWKENERLKKLAELEEGAELDEDDEDDEEAWKAWEVEDDDDSDEDGWIAVSSDEEKGIDISDSEDEKPAKKAKKSKASAGSDSEDESEKKEATSADQLHKEDEEAKDATPTEQLGKEMASVELEEKKLSTLATTKILTPADFAKLAELRAAADLEKLKGKNKGDKRTNEDVVDADFIEGPKTRGKSDKAARLAAMEEGREGRLKYGSRKGKLDKPHSTTNAEKARKKNFLMTFGKAKKKQKRSLVDHKRVLTAHVKHQKTHKRKS